MIVFEGEFGFVQPRNRGDQAEAQARARGIAARFQPHETFGDAGAILFGNARSIVGDDEFGAGRAVLEREDCDCRG